MENDLENTVQNANENESDNVISKISESTSLYAKNLKDETLVIKKITERHAKMYKIDSDGKPHFLQKMNLERITEKIDIPLKEISVKEIKALRKSTKCIFLYKNNGKYYYTEMPTRLHIWELDVGEHQCASANNDCKRLSAKSDEEGGCKKVRDHKLELENFPFIKRGYQVFNTQDNCFVVLDCANHETISARYVNNQNFDISKLAIKNFRDFHLTDDDDDDYVFPKF